MCDHQGSDDSMIVALVPLTAVALLVAGLWVSLKDTKMRTLRPKELEANSAATTEGLQAQVAVDVNMSATTLCFRNSGLEEEFRYQMQLACLVTTRILFIGLLVVLCLYLTLSYPGVRKYLLHSPCVLLFGGAVTLTSKTAFHAREAFVDLLFLISIFAGGVCTLCGTILFNTSIDCSPPVEFSVPVLMLYLTGAMFSLGNIWIAKALTSITLLLCYAGFTAATGPHRNAHMLSRVTGGFISANTILATVHTLLVVCAGYCWERNLRAECARTHLLLTEKEHLQTEVRKLRESASEIDVGEMGATLRELELKSPLQGVLNTLTRVRAAMRNTSIREALDYAICALETTEDLRGVDLSSRLDPSGVHVNGVEVDRNLGDWLRQMFRPRKLARTSSARGFERPTLTTPRSITHMLQLHDRGALATTARSKGMGLATVTASLELDAGHVSDCGSDRSEPDEGAGRVRRVLPKKPSFFTSAQLMSLSPSEEIAMLLYLRKSKQWSFDIFYFAKMTHGRPLMFVAGKVFDDWALVSTFGIDVDRLRRFLITVDENYCHDRLNPNPYHTSLHAADVLQTASCFMEEPNVKERVDPLKTFAVFVGTYRVVHHYATVAAMMHDFRHKGVSNTFLVNSEDELAIVHNDVSVLERFHAAETFRLLKQDECNILHGMEEEDRKVFRHLVIDIILATDLSQGFKYVTMFQTMIDSSKCSPNKNEDTTLLLEMLIKCADVSHAAKPLEVHLRWTALITEEFFRQGDTERELQLPVSPLCDRFTCTDIPKQQQGFMEFVVSQTLKPFSRFCGNNTWIDHLQMNYRYWQECRQQGSYSLERLKQEVGML